MSISIFLHSPYVILLFSKLSLFLLHNPRLKYTKNCILIFLNIFSNLLPFILTLHHNTNKFQHPLHPNPLAPIFPFGLFTFVFMRFNHLLPYLNCFFPFFFLYLSNLTPFVLKREASPFSCTLLSLFCFVVFH